MKKIKARSKITIGNKRNLSSNYSCSINHVSVY